MPRLIRRPYFLGRAWFVPRDAVWVGRGSKWANPFRAFRWSKVRASTPLGAVTVRVRPPTVSDTVEWFRDFITCGVRSGRLVVRNREVSPQTVREELAGKDLVCSCRYGGALGGFPYGCHGDYLLDLAAGAVSESVRLTLARR
ncbi:DUF4326 domain-containing protein [Pseudactinotalea sp. HY160]|uniref:DUF4326 domain-containing protein n=1 Tax=Pseudactinotalea sp. HY160 TaxID=2654490 RepID=UPI001883BC5B|nr:DUF4326 domain-containing protein [Pseudactinotalea sp. HY160]